MVKYLAKLYLKNGGSLKILKLKFDRPYFVLAKITVNVWVNLISFDTDLMYIIQPKAPQNSNGHSLHSIRSIYHIVQ